MPRHRRLRFNPSAYPDADNRSRRHADRSTCPVAPLQPKHEQSRSRFADLLRLCISRAKSWRLRDRGLAAFAKMNINIDGYARAYHPKNFDGGAVMHLCNAGEVFLPDGTS